MRTEKITENPKSENPRSEISEKLICIILFIALLRSVPVSSKDICIKKNMYTFWIVGYLMSSNKGSSLPAIRGGRGGKTLLLFWRTPSVSQYFRAIFITLLDFFYLYKKKLRIRQIHYSCFYAVLV